jgi:Holliday junction resolvasome RuvABC endonuclease subunit
MSKYVIGIDPSSSISNPNNCIGFSVFLDDNLIETGEIIPDPLTGFTRVRRWIRDKIKMIRIRDSNPDIIVACESAYYKLNASVFMGLIRVKAHIEAAVLDEACIYREISPMVSFRASTGLTQYPLNSRGKRDGTRKPAIQFAVKSRYNLPDDTSEHVCDSIAIAEAVIKWPR